jgi:hypothetical protein
MYVYVDAAGGPIDCCHFQTEFQVHACSKWRTIASCIFIHLQPGSRMYISRTSCMSIMMSAWTQTQTVLFVQDGSFQEFLARHVGQFVVWKGHQCRYFLLTIIRTCTLTRKRGSRKGMWWQSLHVSYCASRICPTFFAPRICTKISHFQIHVRIGPCPLAWCTGWPTFRAQACDWVLQ